MGILPKQLYKNIEIQDIDTRMQTANYGHNNHKKNPQNPVWTVLKHRPLCFIP